MNIFWSSKDNYLITDEAWASKYQAIRVLEVVGKRRSYTRLEEAATGKYKGGRGGVEDSIETSPTSI